MILRYYHRNFISILCRKSHSLWRILLLFLKLMQNYLVSPVGVQTYVLNFFLIMQILRSLLLRMKCHNQWFQPHHLEHFRLCLFKKKIQTQLHTF